jgi:hypothetical protein
LYEEVCLLGDFNVDLLDPGHSLFARFLDFLEMFMLCNVAIFPVRDTLDTLVPVCRIRLHQTGIDYAAFTIGLTKAYADGLVERKYGGFVSVNLDPNLPPRKFYQNLRGLGVVNAPE